MRAYIIYALLVGYGSCQYVKSGVKGGYREPEFQEHAGKNLVSLFGNKTNTGSQRSYHKQQDRSGVGVCTTEVPNVVLAKDQSHVPTGNRSHSHRRVTKVCCEGYVQNIHNPTICDPICTNECVNALCTAPETCSCFADHVKNLAGFCVPTCPIGCQNGHCSGRECICKEGYTLNLDSKYCVPSCKDNCGGFGNCTAPNFCFCRTGYQASADGSCKPICNSCSNGDCVAPNNCSCRPGYAKNEKGECTPYCSKACASNEQCVGPETCTNTSMTAVIHGGRPYLTTNQSYPTYNHSNNLYNSRQPNYTYPNYIKPDSTQYNTNDSQNVFQKKGNPLNSSSSDSRLEKSTTKPQSNEPNNASAPNYIHQSYPYQSYPFLPYYPNQPYPFQPYYPNQPYQFQPYYPNQPYPYPPIAPTSYYPNNFYQPYNPNYDPKYINNLLNEVTTMILNNPSVNQPNSDPSLKITKTNQQGHQIVTNQINSFPSQTQESSAQGQITQRFPECSEPCINGICVEGNRCVCYPGYVMDPSTKSCLSSDQNVCPNGICPGPNVCLCNLSIVKRTRRALDYLHSKKP